MLPSSHPKTCGFVFARGGSKGVPNKNLRRLGGVSLLERSVIMSSQIVGAGMTWVSTDSDAIAEEAEALGVGVIRRGAELSGDHSPEWLAWQHAISEVQGSGVRFDYFLSLPTTAPLRKFEDVIAVLAALDSSTDCVVGVTRAKSNPFFNMVLSDQSGGLGLVCEGDGYNARQLAPEVFSMTTAAYVSRPQFILGHSSIWEGRVRGIEIPEERALDIDTEWDLRLAELIVAGGSEP